MKHVHDRVLCAGAGDQPLYQVLEQQQAQVGGNLMGSDHTYIIPGGKPGPGKKCAPAPLPYFPCASGSPSRLAGAPGPHSSGLSCFR